MVRAVFYSPGETLNPTCAPTDVGCGITPPASSGANSNITSITGLTTPLSVGQGGTGTSTYQAGRLLYASTSSTIAGLAMGGEGQVLKTVGGVLTWGNDAGGTAYTAGNGLVLNTAEFSILVDGTSVTTSPSGLKIADTYDDDFFTLTAWYATTTDALGEGGTNQYFTNSRARTALSSSATGLSYDNSTGVFSLTAGYVIPLTASTTDWQTAFSWGNHASAGYLTSESDPVWLAASSSYFLLSDWYATTTDALGEGGTNQYFTNSRARTALSSSATGLSYDNSTGVFSLTAGYVIPLTASTTDWQTAFSWGNHASAGYLTSESDPVWLAASSSYFLLSDWYATTTDALGEGGTNQYFTNSRARTALSSSATGLSYDNSTGIFSLTSGHNIPLTTNTTNWNTFYYTPSSRISLGTGLTWSSNTIQAAAAYTIPLTASTTDWQTAFTWGNHASAGYAILAGQSGGQALNGGTAAGEGLTLSSTSNATKGKIFFGTSAYDELNNRLGIGTSAPSSSLHITNGSFLQTVGSSATVLATYSSSTPYDGASSIAVSGDYAYVANQTGDSISITNIADPTNPIVEGYLFDGTYLNGASGIDVAGDYAYVAGFEGDTLTVVDVHIKSSPTIVGHILDNTDLNGAYSVKVSGNRAYVMNTLARSLAIVDISDPTQPALLGVLDTVFGFTIPQVIDIQGSYVFLGTDYSGSTSEFNVIDVSDPTNPQLVGTSEVSLGSVYGIKVNGNYAYVGTSLNQLSILDISDVTSPVEVGNLGLSSTIFDLQYSGRYLYAKKGTLLTTIDVSTPATPREVNTTTVGIGNIDISGKHIYNVTNGVFKVIDITGIDSPAADIGSLQSDIIDVTNDVTIGNNAFIGGGLSIGSGGLLSTGGLSVSNPDASSYFAGKVGIGTTSPSSSLHIANGDVLQTVGSDPALLSTYTSSTLFGGEKRFVVRGNYAYIVDQSSKSFTILDVTDKNNPTYLGSVVSTTVLNGAISVAIQGKYAYVGSSASAGVRVIDISKPTSPQILGTAGSSPQFSYARFYPVGQYTYILGEAFGSLTVANLSNPLNPEVLSYTTSTDFSDPHDMAIAGNYAYIANYTGDSVSVVDISNPLAPSVMGTVASSTALDGAYSIYVSGKYAYVASIFNNSLTIVNIANPSSPSIVSSIKDDTNLLGASSVQVAGRYAYVASTYDSSIRIIDVSDVNNPVMVAGIKDTTNLSSTNQIYLSGTNLYSTTGVSKGLTILSTTGIDVPAARIGNIQSNSLNVNEYLVVGNNAYIANGLVIGAGGLNSYGGFNFSNPSSTSKIAGALVFGNASLETDYLLQLPNDSTKKAKAYAWDTYSDSRVKADQAPLEYGLQEVLQLQPKRYVQKNSQWENGELVLTGGTETFGLIAQEVYDVLPEIVSKPADDSQELWGMQYEKLGPVLVNAIQEQQSQINGLQWALMGTTTTPDLATSPESLLAESNKPLPSAIEFLSQQLEQGAQIFKTFMTERITAVVGVFNRIRTDKLEMKDEVTGELYCITIRNGEWKKVPGGCSSYSSSSYIDNTSIYTPPAPEVDLSSPEEEVVVPPEDTVEDSVDESADQTTEEAPQEEPVQTPDESEAPSSEETSTSTPAN